jgi:hypothetical protein
MCFSASTSFAVAAITGIVGVSGITRVSQWRKVPLASIPLIFAGQQSIEGALWFLLGADSDPSWMSLLANGFVFFALVVWPLWAPFSAGLVESDRNRRLAIVMIFALSIALAYVGLRQIWLQPYEVCMVENSLSYSNGLNYSPVEMALYVLCTCCPFLISSHKALRAFGAILVLGLMVSATLYLVAFISVWCFFAAAASLTIPLFLFETSKRTSWRVQD